MTDNEARIAAVIWGAMLWGYLGAALLWVNGYLDNPIKWLHSLIKRRTENE